MGLNPLNPNHPPEPLEILRVMREQCWDVVGLHRGHDIGIMHLLTADLEIPHQLDELASHGSGVVGHLKAPDELIDLFEHRGLGQVLESLWPGQDDQVLTDDLATDPDRPVGLVGGLDGRQSLFMKGRFDDVGIDQNVGIDKQRVIVPRRHTDPRGADSNPRATSPH